MNMGTWNPGQYEKFKNERSQPFLDLMEMIKPIAGGSALDLGCGTGELTQLLHTQFKMAKTLGIDSSPEMLNKSAEYAVPGLTFSLSDIEKWKAGEQYDLIFSNAALQWCENHETIFTEIYKGMKDGGQIAIQMPMNHDYPTHVLAQQMSMEPHWNELLKGQSYNKYDSLLLVEDYAKLLFKLGFKEQKVTLKVYAHVLENRVGVVEWVKGSMLSYFRSRLSEDDYEKFLQEYQQRLFHILPDEKPYFYPFKRMLLWASK